MRFPFALGLIAGAAIAIAATRDDGGTTTYPPLTRNTANVEQTRNGYVGSAACAECHPDLHARWAKSGHSLSIRPFADDIVAKPFEGEYFTARDLENRIGPGASMTCEGPGGEPRTFKVDRVIGIRRIQMFTTNMEGGRIQVLPVMLEVPKQRWFDYTDFIFGGPTEFEVAPDSANSWYTFARNFNSRCVRCHATDYEIGYDADKGTYETHWKELTIGCESCHSAGAEHVKAWRTLARDPETIVNPARLGVERSNMVCGQCHAESLMVVPGYRPGDDLHAFMDLAGLEDKKHLMPDGRARELIHNLVPMLESRCGPISCSRCHDPHGSAHPGLMRRPLSDDTTCTECHAEIGARLTEHTHHEATSEGSRCVNCHMPRLVIEGGHGATFDHTISIPSIENTDRLGLPNACRSCHQLEDPGYEYEAFRKWYPDADRKNHRVALARAISGGRQKKPEAREQLEALRRDPNPIYRAGAVRLLGGYGADVASALDDENALVRRAAIEGVKRTDPKRLEPLLDDPNAVLRYRAALALAEREARRRPELRKRVIAVLEAFRRQRNDLDATHYHLGILYDVDLVTAEAIAAYERYLRINPWDTNIQKRVEVLRKRKR